MTLDEKVWNNFASRSGDPPRALKEIVSEFSALTVNDKDVAGMGSNAPLAFGYNSCAEVVSAKTCDTGPESVRCSVCPSSAPQTAHRAKPMVMTGNGRNNLLLLISLKAAGPSSAPGR